MSGQAEIPDKRLLGLFQAVSGNLPHRVPLSTYRLQFNSSFRFRDAKALVPYLGALGITDIYSSPYFTAREGSTHGYDITSHTSLNPEVGTWEEHEEFTGEVSWHGMGQILDIVPNHMSISSGENMWWYDVLENGPSSPHAGYFDIDWNPVKKQLQDKVILPILGDQYGRVLEDQGLRLEFDSGGFIIRYYSHRLPLDPGTYFIVLSHRIEDLKERLGEDNPHIQELLSIITALKNLPHRTERELSRITERMREKEIIKRRLAALYEECPEFRSFLTNNISIFNGTRHEPESFDLMDGLLGAQVYRLAFWRVATEEINYRRFFDVNDLAAIKMEDPEVFGEAHHLVLKLIREGKVTGIRVDHPDGLHNPTEYFKRLQRECFLELCLMALGVREEDSELKGRLGRLYEEHIAKDPAFAMPFYILGEKILAGSERLPEDWPIFGTTGYVFMNSVCGVFVDTANQKAFDAVYSRFIREKVNFAELLYEKKKLIMQSTMASEINVLGHRLNLISESDRHFRDFTLNSLTDAVVEVIAHFPVYRTYIAGPEISDRDRRYIDMAISKSKRNRFDLGASIFDFLKDVLTLHHPKEADKNARMQWLDFTMKFQQLTGPVMAKGLEDTVFYIYNRMVSLNEVGGNPERFGTTVEAFHGQNIEQLKNHPFTLNATTTHDSKRCEDVRSRISVLSEVPGLWKQRLSNWARTNRKKKARIHGRPAPDRNEEYLLYQTLLGSWPHGEMDEKARLEFGQRVSDYMLKAARESKENTTWINPNAEYEAALSRFVGEVLNSGQFLEDFLPFAGWISDIGMFNSLSQTLLKIASPGVPDFYQGTELWSLCLVDPDNRQPVDYQMRARLLEGLVEREQSIGPDDLARELLSSRADGSIKLYLTYKALNYRRDQRDLFLSGQYTPLATDGKMAENLIAFERANGGTSAIAVAPRLVAGLLKDTENGEGPVGEIWHDTRILLPMPSEGKKGAERRLRDIFTGRTVTTDSRGEALLVSDVLSVFPVALLEELK